MRLPFVFTSNTDGVAADIDILVSGLILEERLKNLHRLLKRLKESGI